MHQYSQFFFFTCRSIVSVRQRDVLDHINWLVDQAKQEAAKSRTANVIRYYEDACNTSLNNESLLPTNTVQAVGTTYLSYLMTMKLYAKAAEWCPRLLRK
jgi:hypothetical protein